MNWIIALVLGIIVGTLFGSFLFGLFVDQFVEGVDMLKAMIGK